jgi:hypothetical protein
MTLFRDPEVYQRVDEEIHEVFGQHVVVDATRPGLLSLALSSEAPPKRDWQLTLDEASIHYMATSTPISRFGDGVQAYIGLLMAVESLPHSIILVDEPEAFLHPSLANRLGARLARVARERGASLIASTHSSNFLMGCIGEVPSTTIVRLTYDGQSATARSLLPANVHQLVRQPIIRSVDPLQALFTRSCVVCESDKDRAFYEEINRRHIEDHIEDAVRDGVFLNAQNWQTIPIIAAPLRRLGIPAAMVMDIDVLTESLKDHLNAAGISGQHPVHVSLDKVRPRLAEVPRDQLKAKGVGMLAAPARRQVEGVIEELASIGIFIVPVGEVEGWLRSLGVTNKKNWLTDMLTRLGAPGDPAYVRTGDGDVWDFVRQIARWASAPDRGGMP